MNARTRRIVVFSALPIALIWGFYNLVVKTDSAGPSTAASSSTATIASAVPTSQPTPLTDSAAISKILSRPWGADPFRGRAVSHDYKSSPPPTAATAGLSWVLNGIIFSEPSPIAYVNGRMVKVGDLVNSAKVISIERRAVTLDVGGRRLTISLSKEAKS